METGNEIQFIFAKVNVHLKDKVKNYIVKDEVSFIVEITQDKDIDYETRQRLIKMVRRYFNGKLVIKG